MSNVLSEEKKQLVIALGRLGWPLRRIEEETGVRRETAGAYLKAAGIGVRPPGAWGRRPPAKPANENGVTTGSDVVEPANPNPDPENLPDKVRAKPANENGVTTGSDVAEPANPNPENLPNKVKAKPANAGEVTTGFGVELSPAEPQTPPPVPSISLCEPFREAIELGLSKGRNATGIWQDLVSESGFNGGYQTVKRFVRKLRGNQPPQARAVIITAPGEECQVDYGTGPMVRDPQTGKYRRTRLFVLTLGCSRKAVRLLCFRSSSRIWAELHEKAFRRLGGSTRIVVLDNLKEGVLVPDIYDPALNPLYRDVLTHYGSVALTCRIQDPDRKA
jgi:transposase